MDIFIWISGNALNAEINRQSALAGKTPILIGAGRFPWHAQNGVAVRHPAPDLRATIVTHSSTIAVELATHANIEVILLGGRAAF